MHYFFIRQYIKITVLVLFCVGISYLFFVIQNETQQQVQLLITSTRTVRAYEQQKSVFAKEVSQSNFLTKKIQTLEQYMPSESVVTDTIKKIANDAGFTDLVVTKTQQDKNQITITVDGVSTLQASGAFFAALQKQPYAIVVQSSTFSKQEQGWRTHATVVVSL